MNGRPAWTATPRTTGKNPSPGTPPRKRYARPGPQAGLGVGGGDWATRREPPPELGQHSLPSPDFVDRLEPLRPQVNRRLPVAGQDVGGAAERLAAVDRRRVGAGA